MILSLDPATKKIGWSIWEPGVNVPVMVAETVCPNPRWVVSERLKYLHKDFTEQMDQSLGPEFYGKIDRVLFETVQDKIVKLCMGVVLLSPYITCNIRKVDWVNPSTWKKYAQSLGVKGTFSQIKGIEALKICHPELVKYAVGDDSADSMLQYKTWEHKYGLS